MSASTTTIPVTTAVVAVWLASILGLIVVGIFAIPMAFFLMLFLGNLGLHLSFFACVPGAMVLSSIRTRANTNGST